jgi:hypothetical protein
MTTNTSMQPSRTRTSTNTLLSGTRIGTDRQPWSARTSTNTHPSRTSSHPPRTSTHPPRTNTTIDYKDSHVSIKDESRTSANSPRTSTSAHSRVRVWSTHPLRMVQQQSRCTTTTMHDHGHAGPNNGNNDDHAPYAPQRTRPRITPTDANNDARPQ